MKNLYITIIILIFLSSCSSFKEVGQVMRNEKIKTNDEFLIEKKEPLVLPPDYKDLPEPDSVKNKEKKDDKIKKILKTPQEQKKKQSSSVENSILDKISR